MLWVAPSHFLSFHLGTFSIENSEKPQNEALVAVVLLGLSHWLLVSLYSQLFLGLLPTPCFMVAESRGQVSSKGAPHGHEGLKNKISCFPILILSSIMPTETKFDIWLFSL